MRLFCDTCGEDLGTFLDSTRRPDVVLCEYCAKADV